MEAKFEDSTPTFQATFESDENSFSANMENVHEVLIYDHTKLLNRDAENQHPMWAITGLTEELESKPNEALTNLEIEALLK